MEASNARVSLHTYSYVPRIYLKKKTDKTNTSLRRETGNRRTSSLQAAYDMVLRSSLLRLVYGLMKALC